MAITTIPADDGKALTIKVQGRFDFSCHQDFRRSYESADKQTERYIVDLGDTTYLDSSALGMLLLLRDHAGGEASKIKITNCNPDVKKILTISNFEQLFAIE